jgi:putative component of membrane protein insertase Oxa1/YidC/SpoIIIJ protein YidD
MKLFTSILSIFVLLFFHHAKAQQIDELGLLQQSFSNEKKAKVYTEARNNKNELQFTFSMMFLFYKSFISSQDNSRCNFTPSCSEYALQSIKKFGLIKGSLNAMDRLSRCNGMAPEQYEIDEHLHLLIDKP